MFDNITGLVLTITPIILFVIKLVASEFVTELVKSIFNSKTKKQTDLIFYLIISIIFLVGAAVFVLQKTKQPAISQSEYNIKVYNEEQRIQKTKDELIKDGIVEGVNEIKEGVGKYQEKSEQIRKTKGNIYVYQIGGITENKEAIFQLYNKLINEYSIESNHLFVLEKARGKYIMYYDTFEKDSINIKENYIQFKSKLKLVSTVELVDLYSYCGAREVLQEQKKPLRNRKYNFEIKQCECDN